MNYKEITISVDSQIIKCKLFTPQGKPKKTIVILVHGWDSSDKKNLPLAQMLSRKGFATLAINLRGCLISDYPLSEFSREDHKKDMESSIDFMRKKYPGYRTVLVGRSYSGYLAPIIAHNKNVDFLVILNPALYPDRDFGRSTEAVIDEDPNAFTQKNETPETNKALSSFARITIPILFILSEKDEEIPRATTKLYERYRNKESSFSSAMLSDADHSLTKKEYKEEFYNVVTDWLVKVAK